MLGDLGKFIVAKGFKKLPKVQKIARSVHSAGALYTYAAKVKMTPEATDKKVDISIMLRVELLKLCSPKEMHLTVTSL